VALTVTPADGFISRLLQQTHQSASSRPTVSPHPVAVAKQDQSSISHEARQTLQNADNSQFESKLIDLYNQKGRKAV